MKPTPRAREIIDFWQARRDLSDYAARLAEAIAAERKARYATPTLRV